MNPEPFVFRGGALSNFARCDLTLPCPFSGRLRTYATVEHWFQACKAVTAAEHDLVAHQASPREAKQAGRLIPLRKDWEQAKEDIMLTALRAKFAEEPFRTKLLRTGDRVLIEDSRRDAEWGARRTTLGWEGKNRLGMLLAVVRGELRSGAISQPLAQLRLEL